MQGRQKTLAEIEEQPFLEILIDHLRREGFRRFILCAGFGADDVERRFASEEIIVSREAEPLGTAGALKNAEPLIRSDRLFVVNGDSFCSFSCEAMRRFHEAHRARATVAIVAAEPTSDGGFVRVDADGRILGFREKSFEGSFAFLNAGTYLFERAVLDAIPASRKYSVETELFPSLTEGVFGFDTKSRLHDIGTPERLEQFRKAYRDGSV